MRKMLVLAVTQSGHGGCSSPRPAGSSNVAWFLLAGRLRPQRGCGWNSLAGSWRVCS
jgi:hypothetical protein